MVQTVYAIGVLYLDTHSFGERGTLDSEQEARTYCAYHTRNTGTRVSMKIVRRLATEVSGEVIAFYKNGVECSYEDSIRKGG